ncbi:MAG: O-antigen chain length regulator [Gammaproteobacteria bacterium]|nr:O-antigen chain length regulator [Gammaproteobacteria bacterium]MBU1725339.1 O-antigen chain length regulator [Gammaproteobacteria bacterium]MBU2004348.1 O-antigen chain length regulator [Gammaproteobacteria bacterium]
MSDNQELYQDDEIDLRELFNTLWEGKFLILAIAGTITAGGLAHALLAPQEWSAKAIVVEPLASDVAQLQQRLERIAITTSINTNTNTNTNTDFLAAFSEEKLFAGFIQAFNAFDSKATFLKEKDYLPPMETEDERTFRGTIASVAKGITATQKKNETFYTLSFAADNATDAAKRMNEYLDFINAKETSRINQQIADKIKAQTEALSLQYQLQKADTLKRLQEDITRTELALRVSRAAGVEAPVENLNNQTLITIDLGAKALDEKLKVLKEIKEPEILSSSLADTRLKLDSLKALPSEAVSFTPYHFLQSPAEPISRDKPKRSLIVAISAMLGLILGAMTVMFRSWWRKTAA